MKQSTNAIKRVFFNEKIIDYSILAISIYFFFWIVLGAYYAYPSAEDLMISANYRDFGILNTTIELLLTHDGRYTTNLLHGFNPLIFNFYYGYKLMPIITFGLLIGALFGLFSVLFPQKKKTENGIYAFGLVVFFLSILDLAPTIYWLVATYVYIYPLIFFILFYRSFLLFYCTNSKLHYSLSLLFLFLSVGGNELHLPIFGILLIAILFFHGKKTLKNLFFNWYVIIYVASSILFISSPGIINRFNKYSIDRTSTWTDTFTVAYDHMLQSFNTMTFVPLIGFLILFSIKFFQKIKLNKQILITSIGLLFVYFTWILMTYLKGNKGYPSRITSIPMSVAILSLLLFFSYQPILKLITKYKRTTFIFFLFSLLLFDSSYSQIKNDFKQNKLAKYKTTMDANYQIFKRAISINTNCYKRAMINDFAPDFPQSIGIWYHVILPNRGDRRWNQGYEKYFKLDEVSLKSDSLNLSKTYYEKLR